jgi:hypothetical protein
MSGLSRLIAGFGDLRFLCILALLFAWLAVRSFAKDDSRTRTGLGLVALSNLSLPIVTGIPAISTQTPIGKSEAVFVWVLLSLALFEVFLRGYRPRLNPFFKRMLILMGIFWSYGFVYAILQNHPFRPSFFYVPVSLVIVALLSPDTDSINPIITIMKCVIILLFLFVILRLNF